MEDKIDKRKIRTQILTDVRHSKKSQQILKTNDCPQVNKLEASKCSNGLVEINRGRNSELSECDVGGM